MSAGEGVKEILFKAAATAQKSYAMKGQLYVSQTGWLLLHVPNAMARGVYATIGEPGLELPPAPGGGPFSAHISVMNADEVESIGGPGKINERGRDFSYTLGPLRTVTPAASSENSRVWYVEVTSPDLVRLRKSYGLSGTPNNGEHQFHITVAVRRKNMGNGTDKASPPSPIVMSDDAESFGSSRLFKVSEFFQSLGKEAGDAPESTGDSAGGDPFGFEYRGLGRPGTGNGHEAAAAGEPDDARPGGTPSEKLGSAAEETVPAKHAAEDPELRDVSRVTLKQTISRQVRQIKPPVSKEQADAGNYRKGHVHMHGLAISIETKAGDKRSPEWPALKNHYGYIKRTIDADGDQVDVFLGEDPDVELVYVIDQQKPDSKRFDEHKCMLGFRSKKDAKNAYMDNYEAGWGGFQSITPLTVQQFKEWLADGDTTKPMAKQTFTVKKAAEGVEAVPVLVLQRAQGIEMVYP